MIADLGPQGSELSLARIICTQHGQNAKGPNREGLLAEEREEWKRAENLRQGQTLCRHEQRKSNMCSSRRNPRTEFLGVGHPHCA